MGVTLIEEILPNTEFAEETSQHVTSDDHTDAYDIYNTSGSSFTADKYNTYDWEESPSTASFSGSLDLSSENVSAYVYFSGGVNEGTYAYATTFTGNDYRDAFIIEGAGSTTISAGAGNDLISAGAGDDSLLGGNDNDTIFGGSGADTIWGGEGDDQLYAFYALIDDEVPSWYIGVKDIIDGAAGDDYIEAYDGTITGGSGNDILIDRGGNCSIDGGDDDDYIEFEGDNNTIVGGNGIDQLSFYSRDLALSLTLTEGGSVTGGGGTGNSFSGLEGIYATLYNDTITGNSQANLLTGSDGNDTIIGAAGNDTIAGEEGDDSLTGGADADSINGDNGNDTIEGGAGADTLIGGTGVNTLSYAFSSAGVSVSLLDNTFSGGDAAGDSVSGFTNVIGSAYADTISGDNADNLLDGGAGDDFLFAKVADDTVYGGTGNDNITGLGGTDVLYGGADNDTIQGGDDSDVLYGDNGNDVLNGDGGTDSVYGGGGNDTIYGSLGDDTFYGGTGDDFYDYSIGTNVVSEDADAGTDTVQTSNSSITLWANVENLIMTGSANLNAAGNALGNAITGNSGNNAIWGHGGIDTITGGSGTDTFLFTANSDSGNGLGSRDIITDFNQRQSDIIDLSAFAGTFSFIGTGAFTGASQARYSQTGSDTIIDVDSNGDGSYDFQIELTGLITLVATDFVL